MLQADQSTVLHTALAGILAVDSCLKALEREDKFVVGNLLRANSAIVSSYLGLKREMSGECG